MNPLTSVWKEIDHPRDRLGRFRSKWSIKGPAKELLDSILETVNPRQFTSPQQANVYLNQRFEGGKPGGRKAVLDYLGNFRAINAEMKAGKNPPEADALRASMKPLDDDLMLTQSTTPGAFGLDAQSLGLIEELTGKEVMDRTFTTTWLGGGTNNGGITMHILAPRGTMAAHPGGVEVILSDKTPIRVTRVNQNPDGTYAVMAVALPEGSAPNAKSAREAMLEGQREGDIEGVEQGLPQSTEVMPAQDTSIPERMPARNPAGAEPAPVNAPKSTGDSPDGFEEDGRQSWVKDGQPITIGPGRTGGEIGVYQGDRIVATAPDIEALPQAAARADLPEVARWARSNKQTPLERMGDSAKQAADRAAVNRAGSEERRTAEAERAEAEKARDQGSDERWEKRDAKIAERQKAIKKLPKLSEKKDEKPELTPEEKQEREQTQLKRLEKVREDQPKFKPGDRGGVEDRSGEDIIAERNAAKALKPLTEEAIEGKSSKELMRLMRDDRVSPADTKRHLNQRITALKKLRSSVGDPSVDIRATIIDERLRDEESRLAEAEKRLTEVGEVGEARDVPREGLKKVSPADGSSNVRKLTPRSGPEAPERDRKATVTPLRKSAPAKKAEPAKKLTKAQRRAGDEDFERRTEDTLFEGFLRAIERRGGGDSDEGNRVVTREQLRDETNLSEGEIDRTIERLKQRDEIVETPNRDGLTYTPDAFRANRERERNPFASRAEIEERMRAEGPPAKKALKKVTPEKAAPAAKKAAPAKKLTPAKKATGPAKGDIIEWTNEDGKVQKGEILSRQRDGSVTVRWAKTGRTEKGIDPNAASMEFRRRGEGDAPIPALKRVPAAKKAPAKKALPENQQALLDRVDAASAESRRTSDGYESEGWVNPADVGDARTLRRLSDKGLLERDEVVGPNGRPMSVYRPTGLPPSQTKIEGVAPAKKAPAKKLTPVREKADTKALATRIGAFDGPTREEAADMVKDLNKTELVEVATELKIPGAKSLNMARLRAELVELAGRRQDSIAIRGFRGERIDSDDAERGIKSVPRPEISRASDADFVPPPRRIDMEAAPAKRLPRVKRPAGETRDVNRIWELIDNFDNPPDRAEVDASLADLNRKEMEDLASRAKILKIKTKTIDQLRDEIVEYAGRRIDSIAVRGFRGRGPSDDAGNERNNRIRALRERAVADLREQGIENPRMEMIEAQMQALRDIEGRDVIRNSGAKKALPSGRDEDAMRRQQSRDRAESLTERMNRLRLVREGDAAPGQSTPTKAGIARATEKAVTGTSTVSGNKSIRPIAENTWGGAPAPGGIHYHEDGAIGTAVRRMGDDARMDVDGEPLANVLGKIATDTVMGRTSAGDLVDKLKDVSRRLPEGSKARTEVDRAIQNIDAPPARVDLPDGMPAPIVELARTLEKIPAARSRKGYGWTLDRSLVETLGDLARSPGVQGRTGRTLYFRLMNELRDQLFNKHHESTEGKMEMDRAVTRAMDALQQLFRNS